MTSRAPGVGIAIALLLLGVWALWPGRRDHVTVAITNATSRRVEWVALDHERGGGRFDHLAPHAAGTIRFPSRGENSFTLRARFADGPEVRSASCYAEPGYAFHAAIHDSAIVVSPAEHGY